MTRQILLVRHTEVARAWKGRCYGQSDMGLSLAGAAHARELAGTLAGWRPERVVHSGLRRAAILAEAVAAIAGVAAHADLAWQERDFGSWEGRSWGAIYRETGDAMDGMIDDPDGFRPGGGETTSELAMRARDAFQRLPDGRTMVVTHGGPIAAIAGSLSRLPPRDWLALVPALGASLEL